MQAVGPYAQMWQQSILGRQARRAARQQAALMRAMVRQMQIDAKEARDRWQLDMQARFPQSPIYGALTPQEFVDVPVRLTTKQTRLQQAQMLDPNNPRLGAKLAKVGRNIATYGAKHPGAVTHQLVTRK